MTRLGQDPNVTQHTGLNTSNSIPVLLYFLHMHTVIVMWQTVVGSFTYVELPWSGNVGIACIYFHSLNLNNIQGNGAESLSTSMKKMVHLRELR